MKQESETVPESEHLETEIPEPPKTEIELKFEVRPEHMMRLKRAPWVKAAMDGPAKVKTLNARYFDTPDLKLRRKGLYLRARKEGRDYVQCVKARESGDAGAFARLEWESVVPRGHPDPTLVTDDKGRTLLPIKDSAELEEVFESRVRRSQRRLTPDSDSAISLDLDVGEIASGSKSEPICEAELEVISGDRRHLFDVALQLLDEVPARLVADTKADRGYALYSGGSPDWCKAEPLLLDRGVTAENALARMVMNCIDHMRRNEACVLARADDEGVHQMRVATRRLRSSLAIYKRLLPAEQQGH